MKDDIGLSAATADAFDGLVCHVGQVNVSLPDMAWLVLVLKKLPDAPRLFPRGKWATIQHIEAQLDECAMAEAIEVAARWPDRVVEEAT